MMTKPTVNELLDVIDDRYELVAVTAKRARQLKNGARSLVNTEEPTTVSMAAKEISEGKIKVINQEEIEGK